MWRLAAAAVMAGLVWSHHVDASNETRQLSENIAIEERGGNAWRKYGIPSDSLIVHQGELRDLRDIQGWHRLDIGAGNAEQPGTLALGADVTRRLVFHVRNPGQPPRKMMEITPRGITFHVKPKVVGRALKGSD
jgi:hypothetical protein